MNFKRVSIASFLLIVACMGAFGQTATPDPSAPPSLASFIDRDVLVVLGPSFISGNGTPQVGGTFGASFPFSATLSGGVFGDVAFRRTGAPQINIRGQVAQKLFNLSVGKQTLPVSVLADVGSAFAASDPNAAVQNAGKALVAVLQNVGTNVGYIAATGIQTEVVAHGIHVQPYARIIKGSLNDAGWCAGMNFGIPVKVKKIQVQ